MKNSSIVLSVFLLLVSSGLWADSASLSYVDGQVTLEKAGGMRKDAAIGDSVQTGDTVFTGSDGLAEISMDSGSTISIQSGTVFNVGEVADPETESRKRGFFRVLLGNVGFKFRNLTQEPDVGTPLAVCSVRGTDFTVFTAPDGASMTVVSDGLVEVRSGGDRALLAADEGIEVVVGLGLGEPFDAKRGIIRYDAFVKQALKRIDDDSIGSLQKQTAILNDLINDGKYFLESWETNFVALEDARAEAREVREEKGDEAGAEAYRILVPDLQDRALDLNRTYRYYLISALYMRRYVMTSYYLRMRTQYLTSPDNPEWLRFEQVYDRMLELYENRLIPILSEGDL